MADLMVKYNYRGWYVGVLSEDDFAKREKKTPEFGPFSKNMAKKVACVFNKSAAISQTFKGFYAVAISGREALSWLIERAERQAGWDPNP